MKYDIYTLRISAGNRVTFPMEMRKKLDLNPGDKIVWTIQENPPLVSFHKKVD